MKFTAYLNEESLGSVLGIEKDVERYRFLDACAVLKEQGIEVEVYDALKDKEMVKDIAILPCFKVNGEIVVSGKYPSNKEIAEYFSLDASLFSKGSSDLVQAANDGRIGYCCGVGTDIYLDPNEEE